MEEELRPQLPLPAFFPDLSHEYDHRQSAAPPDDPLSDEEIKLMMAKFPEIQRRPEDLMFCTRAILRFNKKKEFQGIVALTIHFIGFFHIDPYGDMVCDNCAHLFDICSIRVKSQTKVLIFCRVKDTEGLEDVVNSRIISNSAIKLTQILYRNYMLSTVHDSSNRADIRSFNHDYFPEFDNGFSASQAYQMTYYAFCSRLGVKYNHEVTRFYHEHIRKLDGVFDFTMLPYELIHPNADIKDLLPAIYAMMYVPYVQALICHRHRIPFISGAVSRIVYKSNYLQMVHLSDCLIDSKGMDAIGRGLCNNIHEYRQKCISKDEKYKNYKNQFPVPIPVRYWNFEDNTGITEADSFFEGLKKTSADLIYLSFSNCRINDMRNFFISLIQNVHLYNIKYLFFNGNNVDYETMKLFVQHLNNIANHMETMKKMSNSNLSPASSSRSSHNNTKTERSLYDRDGKPVNQVSYYKHLGVAGDDRALKTLFKTLQRREFPIELLSLAGTQITRHNVDIDVPSAGASYVIKYVQSSPYLKVLDLSSPRIDCEDIQLIMRAFYNNKHLDRVHIKLNNINLSGNNLISIAKGFLYTDLEKWEILEFANTGLTEFELDFLVSIFWRMPNLTELNLNFNFPSCTKGVSNILCKLGIIQNLTRLHIAGIRDHPTLNTKLIPLLEDLIDRGNIEELDVSGNNIGDEGYNLLIKALDLCPNLHSLTLDRNYPKDLKLVEKLVVSAMSKSNLTFFVFPYHDAMYSLQFLPPEYIAKNKFPLINLRYNCNAELNERRKKNNLPPQLPFKTVDEIGQLVSDINDNMKYLLYDSENDVFQPVAHIHGGIALDVKVPFPFLDETIDSHTVLDNSWYVDTHPELVENYHAPNINLRIDEDGFEQQKDFVYPDPNEAKRRHTSSTSSFTESKKYKKKGKRSSSDSSDSYRYDTTTTQRTDASNSTSPPNINMRGNDYSSENSTSKTTSNKNSHHSRRSHHHRSKSPSPRRREKSPRSSARNFTENKNSSPGKKSMRMGRNTYDATDDDILSMNLSPKSSRSSRKSSHRPDSDESNTFLNMRPPPESSDDSNDPFLQFVPNSNDKSVTKKPGPFPA